MYKSHMFPTAYTGCPEFSEAHLYRQSLFPLLGKQERLSVRKNHIRYGDVLQAVGKTLRQLTLGKYIPPLSRRQGIHEIPQMSAFWQRRGNPLNTEIFP